MITAAAARSKTESHGWSNQLREVEGKIVDYANSGASFFDCYLELHEKSITALKDAGFTVKKDGLCYNISW